MNEKYLEIAQKKVADERLLINGVARRAAELARGARPLIPVNPGEREMDYLDLALREVAEGKITIRAVGEEQEDESGEEGAASE